MAGEPVDELWKKVAEIVQAVNALLNMDVRVQSYNIKGGKVLATTERVTLLLE